MSLIFIVELGGTIYLHLKYLFLTPDGVFFGPCSFGWLWLTQTALYYCDQNSGAKFFFFCLFLQKKIHGTTKFISLFENNFGCWENMYIHNCNQMNFHLVLGFNWKNQEISFQYAPSRYTFFVKSQHSFSILCEELLHIQRKQTPNSQDIKWNETDEMFMLLL